MIWLLRVLFATVIVTMLAVTSWAGVRCGLGAIPPAVYSHPWFIATLFDAYWGFITFFVWVAWKERAVTARALWLVAILLLGNMAMAAYMLRELFAVGARAGVEQVITRRNPGRLALPAVLTGLAVAVYVRAWLA